MTPPTLAIACPVARALHWINRGQHAAGLDEAAAARDALARTLAGPMPPWFDADAARAALRRAGAGQRPFAILDAALGHPGHHLLVYGSLAPGARHGDVLAPLPGRWLNAAAPGHVDRSGEYPRFHWRPSGAPAAMRCFASPALPAHWPRIDDFEGADYRRVWVAARVAGRDRVATVYAAADTWGIPA